MTRRLSYKRPSRLALHTTTNTRHDDTDRGTLWTQQEIDWLVENYGQSGSEECGRILRRSAQSVRVKIHRIRHGIKLGHATTKQRVAA